MVKKRGSVHPLNKYIDEQLTNGYSEEVIKKHLLNYGYNKKSINKSFKIVKKKRFHILSRTMIFLCVGISLFFLLWLAMSTSAKLFYVLVGFLPTIVCLIISIAVIEKPKHRNLNILWILPLVLIILFLFIGNVSDVALFKNMDVNKLAGLNFVISFMFVTVLYLTGSLRREEIEIIPEKKLFSRKLRPIKISGEKELKKVLQSVEDKCKVLNFAIGRVYSNKKGGSKDLREKIKVNKVWYNQISEAMKDGYNQKKDKNKIILNIKKIRDRLERLHKTEKEIFGQEHNQLKNLKRSDDGSDKILHVLIKNDKDPVKTYYDGAVEFCERVKKGL